MTCVFRIFIFYQKNVFLCRKISILQNCGHYIHCECLENYIKSNNYNCPICRKSLNDMTSYWKIIKKEIEKSPMPKQYQHWKVKIVCNDCNNQCTISYHFMGNECSTCNGFNTTILEDYRNENENTD